MPVKMYIYICEFSPGKVSVEMTAEGMATEDEKTKTLELERVLLEVMKKAGHYKDVAPNQNTKGN